MSGSQKTTQNTQQSSQTSPWAPQANEILKAFGYADKAYNQASQAQAPTDFTAQFTPDQLATFQNMLGYANNNSVPGANAAAGTALTNAGTNAVTDAFSSLSGWDPSRMTAQNIADATATANSPYMDDMVNAAMRDARQQVRDVTLPGIESGAAGTGNINSTRTGVAQGLVERGLAQQTADTSATLRGQAFNDALNRSSQNIGNFLSTALAKGNLGNTVAGTGIGANSGSIADMTNLFNIANTAGAGQQAADQAKLTNEQQKYQSAVTSPYDAVNQFMKLVGGNLYGSSTTGSSSTEQESTPSIWQIMGGLMSSAGSLMKSDRSAKEDIVQIGTLFDGQPVYRFRYKGERRVQIGLMADECKPSAVFDINGTKHVHYGWATQHLV